MAVPFIRNDIWTEEELYFLKNNYLKMSYAEIGKKINRTRVAVMVKANRIGIKLPEKYAFDKRFFQSVDTEEKAYWLGFIYADGYIGSKYELGIELAEKDFYHLEKFNKHVSGNFHLKYFSKIVLGKSYKMVSIRMFSKLLVNDLNSQGVHHNKSFTILFPYLRNDLIRHFIRGYFDGDGCIYIYKKRNFLHCKFTSGSKEFLLKIEKILNNMSIKTRLSSFRNQFDLSITNRKATRVFLEYIYENCNIYLDRKYNFYKSHKRLLEYRLDAWNHKTFAPSVRNNTSVMDKIGEN